MPIEQAFQSCKVFPVADAVVSLWTFKKRDGGGFSAKSIDFTVQVAEELKAIVVAALHARTEVEDYTFLAQCNEVGCLHVETDETSFADLQALVDLPAEEHRVSTDRDLKNISAYLIRLRAGEQVLYCIKQVTDAWKTRKSRDLVNVVFHANRLELVQDKSFTIAKSLDFVVLDNDVFIFKKRAFESLLGYKVEYENSFSALQEDASFVACFSDLQPLVEHVGTNTMHLRRLAVIHQRGHYADPAYMERLRQVNAEQQWNIQFNEDGRIVATPETIRVIMQVLLNHRLYSQLSLSTFDVPAATAVAV
jgi:hypothetical protein